MADALVQVAPNGATVVIADAEIVREYMVDAQSAQAAAEAASAGAATSASNATAQANLSEGYAVQAASYRDAASSSASQSAGSASTAGTAALNASASYNAIAAAIAGYPAGGVPPTPVATRAIMKAIANPVGAYIVYADGPVASFVVDAWANLSADAANQGPTEWYYVQSSTDATKGFRRDGNRLTPFMAGCAGDGVADDHVALQAFNDFVFAKVRKEIADFGGNFATTQKINLGPSVANTDHWKQLHSVTGDCRIVATAALNEIVNINNLSDEAAVGLRVTAVGTGGASYSSRTCGIGIVLNNCANGLIAACRSFATLYHGVYAPSSGVLANDCLSIAHVRGGYFGSGPVQTPSQCLTANWSNPVLQGTLGSVLASTKITVDALPPALLDNYEAWGIKQCAVWMGNEEPAQVIAIDRVNNTITIQPTIDSALGNAGSLTYIYGAAFATSGGDSGICHIGHLEALNGGIGLGDAALYGTRVDSHNIENVSAAQAWGGIGAAHYGTCLDAGYDIDNVKAQVMIFAAAGSISYDTSNYFRDVNKIFVLNGARNASDVISTQGQVNSNGLAIGGKQHSHLQEQNANALPTGITLKADRPPLPLIYSGSRINSVSCQLTNTTSGKWHQLFGYTGGTVWLIGTGQNGAPSGTVTFKPPTQQLASCTVVAGNATITVPLSGIGTRGLAPGMPVSGTGIPAGATIATVPNRTSFTVDGGHLPTANGTVTLTITGSVNGVFGNVTFSKFNGPAGFLWEFTDSFEMVWQVNAISGVALTQVVANNALVAYTPAPSAHGSLQRMSGANPVVTLPSDANAAFLIGQWIEFDQLGATAITFAPDAGVTVNSRGGLLHSNGQYSRVKAEKTAANTWLLSGDRG